jgi:sigma-E factor negative regulatory protein RseB
MRSSLRSLVVVCLACTPLASAGSEVLDMLKRINEAAGSINYDGVIVHVSDGHVETMRLVHRVADGEVQERLYALNGAPREVIRNAKEVQCFMPDRNMGVIGSRSGKQAGFPGFMISNLDVLESTYNMHLGGSGRIADRTVTQIVIQPRDNQRYGYELWADSETGLLLRSVLIDHAMNPLEQYLFAMVTIGEGIDDTALAPMTRRSSLEWHTDSAPARVTDVTDSDWLVGELPSGYRLVNMMQRWLPMQEIPVEHLVFSDGLAAVSVFIEQQEGQQVTSTTEQVGAVSAYTTSIGPWLITAVGEVPQRTVEEIVGALSYQPADVN